MLGLSELGSLFASKEKAVVEVNQNNEGQLLIQLPETKRIAFIKEAKFFLVEIVSTPCITQDKFSVIKFIYSIYLNGIKDFSKITARQFKKEWDSYGRHNVSKSEYCPVNVTQIHQERQCFVDAINIPIWESIFQELSGQQQ